jgi:hypothetical protein
MGTIVQATCSCGYCSDDLFIGHGIAPGPPHALATCRHCREMLSIREGRRQCPRCRKRLDTLGIEDVDALIAGLECPRCGKPTLAIESRVRAFKNKLVERFRAAPLPSDLANNIDIQRRFVVPLLQRLVQETPSPRVYAHPWNHKESCLPNCSEGHGLVESPEPHGCPICWESYKGWGVAKGFALGGFDLVVGQAGDSFVVEAQLVPYQIGKKAQALDELYPIRGRCVNATPGHSWVVALCVIQEGALDPSDAEELLQDDQVTPVVRSVPARHGGSTVIIADGTYTGSDETYYVGLGPGRYQSRYAGGTKDDVVARVEADGWQPSGRCGRSDGVAVNMWSRGYRDFGAPAELIAIWDET